MPLNRAVRPVPIHTQGITMENEDVVTTAAERKKPFILFRLWQWFVAACLTLLLVVLAFEGRKLNAPEAPVILFWCAVAALAFAIATLSPPIFFRLSGRLKLGAYLSAVIAFVVTGTGLGATQEAYKRTPEGAKEAAREALAQAKTDAVEAERRKSEAEAAKFARQQQDAADFESKLKACLLWSGRVPAFDEAVQSSLHNPRAFEHVETQLIKDDEEGRNIAMEFRAENAFGAIRTAFVKAKLSPETCEVSNLSEPES